MQRGNNPNITRYLPAVHNPKWLAGGMAFIFEVVNFDYNGYPLRLIQSEPCRDGSAYKFSLIIKFFSQLLPHDGPA